MSSMDEKQPKVIAKTKVSAKSIVIAIGIIVGVTWIGFSSISLLPETSGKSIPTDSSGCYVGKPIEGTTKTVQCCPAGQRDDGTNKDCSENASKPSGSPYCVNSQCVSCRSDSDCPADSATVDYACKNGSCVFCPNNIASMYFKDDLFFHDNPGPDHQPSFDNAMVNKFKDLFQAKKEIDTIGICFADIDKGTWKAKFFVGPDKDLNGIGVWGQIKWGGVK